MQYCPACLSYVMHMQDTYRIEILYLFHHPLQPATILPPSTLKKAVEYVLTVVEKKLTNGIAEISNTKAIKLERSTKSIEPDLGATGNREQAPVDAV